MLQLAKLAIVAILSVFVGFVSNNLPPIPEFPRRNRLLWRIVFWTTLILLVFEVAHADDIPAGLKRVATLGGFMIAVACLIDGWNLVSAWQDHRQHTTVQQETDMRRKQLLKEVENTSRGTAA